MRLAGGITLRIYLHIAYQALCYLLRMNGNHTFFGKLTKTHRPALDMVKNYLYFDFLKTSSS
jgi:hypothetical protein